LIADRSSADHLADDPLVANSIALIVAEPAIAFGDCDRPRTPAASAAGTRARKWDASCSSPACLGVT